MKTVISSMIVAVMLAFGITIGTASATPVVYSVNQQIMVGNIVVEIPGKGLHVFSVDSNTIYQNGTACERARVAILTQPLEMLQTNAAGVFANNPVGDVNSAAPGMFLNAPNKSSQNTWARVTCVDRIAAPLQ